MDFKQYIADAQRFYHYRVKTICVLDDHAMDWFERVLLKYDPVDITKPHKTIIQKNPLDFKNVAAAEVWIVDVTTALPASGYVLQKELQLALGIPENYIVVRGENDPIEIENDRLVADEQMDLDAAAKGLTRDALLTDQDYSEVDTTDPELYGAKYNSQFLGFLRTVQKDRAEKAKVDAEGGYFSWLNQPKPDVEPDEGAYNADIKDAPTIGKVGTDLNNYQTAPEGNMTGGKREYRRLYGKDGVRTTLSQKTDTTKVNK
jgi:hypothetical protein